MAKQNGPLFTISAITSYLGGMSKNTFYRWVKRGMPAIVVDGCWVAHTDNLDDYFRYISKAKMTEIPEDAE